MIVGISLILSTGCLMMPLASAGPEKLWKTWNRFETFSPAVHSYFLTFHKPLTFICVNFLSVQDNNCDDPHADLVMSKKALSLFQEEEEHGQRKTKRKVIAFLTLFHKILPF